MREERPKHVYGEGERNDGTCARSKRDLILTFGGAYHLPNDDGLYPETNESQKRAKRLHDVSIVATGLLDERAQLRIAIRTDTDEDAAQDPH